MERPKSPLEEMYERMTQVIETYGGKAPSPERAKSLNLISDFCWALDCVPRVQLVRQETAPPPATPSE